ncbi:hypothetical protein KHP62_02315 [Rhodobacteraceae bacterium NNCM2]|nr:hypothetical protein [Coraliihabitans acroporae]
MTLVLFIIAVILIGWFVPRLVMDRYTGPYAVVIASAVALILGAAVIWFGAQLAAMIGDFDAQTEFDRGFNAWKIMLLIAPASALQRRKHLMNKGDP